MTALCVRTMSLPHWQCFIQQKKKISKKDPLPLMRLDETHIPDAALEADVEFWRQAAQQLATIRA